MHDPILAGCLQRIPAAALLQVIEAESLTGRLVLQDTPIVMEAREGSIVRARDGAREGVKAVLGAFFLTDGRFELTAHDVEGAPLASTMGLVMEGLRQLDEWNRLRRPGGRPPRWSTTSTCTTQTRAPGDPEPRHGGERRARAL